MCSWLRPKLVPRIEGAKDSRLSSASASCVLHSLVSINDRFDFKPLSPSRIRLTPSLDRVPRGPLTGLSLEGPNGCGLSLVRIRRWESLTSGFGEPLYPAKRQITTVLMIK
jgi:hypothetical protein